MFQDSQHKKKNSCPTFVVTSCSSKMSLQTLDILKESYSFKFSTQKWVTFVKHNLILILTELDTVLFSVFRSGKAS